MVLAPSPASLEHGIAGAGRAADVRRTAAGVAIVRTVSPSEPASQPAELQVTHRVVDGVPVVVATGEIDVDTASLLADAVKTSVDQAAGKPCILDLTDVDFLNSAGLTALLEVARHAEARREPLRIVVDANRPVIRPIEVTGLDDVLALYHSVEEALNARQRP
jgi:anti-sigma B factor antagonist